MVTASRINKYVTEVISGQHKMIADVSPKLGGTDLGPGPHEILEAALAACTIITVQMYADRKNWPLISTNVKVSIDREGPETHLTREISFSGELSSEQRDRLLVIANKCPIHKLLTSSITVTTNLV